MKILRKVNEGIHPEIEIGRFLVEHTDYKNVPDLLGSIELVEGDKRSALVVAHRFVENQGDAWTVTGAYLGRFIDDQRVLSAAPIRTKARSLPPICSRSRQIGRRTGELQSALASRPDIADFAPEPIRPGGHGGLDRAAGRPQQAHASICWRRSAAVSAKPSSAGRPHAAVARRNRRAHPALAAETDQRRSKSATTATSISARC